MRTNRIIRELKGSYVVTAFTDSGISGSHAAVVPQIAVMFLYQAVMEIEPCQN